MTLKQLPGVTKCRLYIKKVRKYISDVRYTRMWYDAAYDMWFPGDMDEEMAKAKKAGLL